MAASIRDSVREGLKRRFGGGDTEGKQAPLRRVDIHDDMPEDLLEIAPVIYTPTFVLLHEGVEIGRIKGYPGEDFFWGMLDQLIKKLPASADNA